jgi:alpha-methylacyl-CoA racemase
MGPLQGVRIIEFVGLGPAPFCGMMLADMGAEIIRIERPGPASDASKNVLARNRKSLACNLKNPVAVEAVLRLIETADGIIEGFRPGVMERLELGPDVCLARNPSLVYGRMTGWGQHGPLANVAGHDLNYLALTGALHLIGEKGRKPTPPLNLIADFGGGGMLLAFGMLCGILSARTTGKGQVVDATMLDGVNAMMSVFHQFVATGLQPDETGAGFLAGAAHFYDTYETKDGRYVSIGPIEPQFYELLIEKAHLDRARFAPHVFKWQLYDGIQDDWAALKAELVDVFRTMTLDEWCDILEGTDVCFAPVLTMQEAVRHPHNLARNAFLSIDGVTQAAPAPRFSATPAGTPVAPVPPGTHSRELLEQAGFAPQEVDALIDAGAVSQADQDLPEVP